MTLILDRGANGQAVRNADGSLRVLSRDNTSQLQSADFKSTGLAFFVPKLTDTDVARLRAGQTISEGRRIEFQYTFKRAGGVPYVGTAVVEARDFATAPNAFFGDRPLADPGYSVIELAGDVGMTAQSGRTIDRLDVYKVEQRLKYLGFPAIGTGNPTVTNNVIQDFVVDGSFATKEQAALKLFEKVVRYTSTGINASFRFDGNGADGKIKADAQGLLTKQWLNAYNAPHWMQLFEATGNATGANYRATNPTLPGWQNQQIGTTNTNVELFGTSWLRDLMAAKQFAPAELRQGASLFNGSVDANYGFTPKWNGARIKGQHATHDLGLAFDLGVSNYILVDGAQRVNEALLPSIQGLTAGAWSLANGIAYSAPMLPSGQAGLPNVSTAAHYCPVKN